MIVHIVALQHECTVFGTAHEAVPAFFFFCRVADYVPVLIGYCAYSHVLICLLYYFWNSNIGIST